MLTKKDLLKNKAFIEASDDAKLVVSYTDFWGDNECTPIIEYNQYSNTIFIIPGENCTEEDES